ncbi:hypothetical protein PLESTB_001490400 [Pleodorina starrii]|uniref:Uncharacterized protein n=1 Tax=Pleodorina starrii TaxID=330485 RepID=A0A9W6BX38_9CHLO|nr:hypothetical protein PLESTM_001453300 [Pleodorina starrii]GLC59465.1 hypothetical protein PLESTB_001490400 [Pleodorina starrii]GLC66334.1 hypothetical protein PLESTF_000412700 [Pleodorina starrii]
MEEAVKTCGFIITLVDEHCDELQARDQFNRGLTAKLLEESQELSSAKDTISALQQQVASLEQQLLSRPQAPPRPQQPSAETSTTSEPSCQQQLEAALCELTSLRGQLADVTSRQQQQEAATEVAAAEAAELRRFAAEAEPLRQRVAEAESAAEALRLQGAVAEQQLRRQLEASRGQVAALQVRVEAVEKEAATSRSKYKTRKVDHNILIWKYEKLIAEKIVLERLYDVLCTCENLDLSFVVKSVVETEDGLRELGEAAKARRLRREQYRREAQSSSKVMPSSWCR